MSEATIDPQGTSAAELRTLVEADIMFRHAIATGDVQHECVELSNHFSNVFTQYGIDHVRLFGDEHTFLAVRTRDQGILLFDPTIAQYYPNEFKGTYFLGSAEKLVDFTTAHGGAKGMQEILEPPYRFCPAVTAETAFLGQRINLAPFTPREHGPAAVKQYFAEWLDALAPIHATTQIRSASERGATTSKARA